MNKYVYSECPQDYFPTIKTILAKSYNDAVEKLMDKYSTEFNNDNINQLGDFLELQEYLNDEYTFAISDLEDIEEL